METTKRDTFSTGLARPSAPVRMMAAAIALGTPKLDDLDAGQLETVARAVVARRLTDDLGRKADLAGIDYAAERGTYLAQARSTHTAIAYAAALDRLDAWTARKALEVLELTPRTADDYAYALVAEGRAPASVRRDIAAASAFFTWLERRHDSIRNPFRGTRARPTKKTAKALEVPTEDELTAILAALPGPARAAAVVMASRGLRVGALPTLTIRAGRFIATSKGKEIAGEIPAEALAAIKAASLDTHKPFDGAEERKIGDAFRYATKKLAQAGTIRAAYSVHDLRHAYAVRQYRATKDIYLVSRLLAHASIQVTETYLRSLGEID